MRKIAVWGTGKLATRFVAIIKKWNELGLFFCGKPIFDIRFFIDSFSRLDNIFFDREVINPINVDWKDAPLIIIAVSDSLEIIKILKGKKLRESYDYVMWKDIKSYFCLEEEINNRICEFLKIQPTINGMNNERIIAAQLKEIVLRLNSMEDSAYVAYKSMLCDWLTRKSVLVIHDDKLKCELAETFIDWMGIIQYNLLLEQIYNLDIDQAYKWLPRIRYKLNNGVIRNIGVYYMRVYNGGVERVISKLLPLYLNKGYKVILFTDEINREKEYHLPENIARVCIGNATSEERYKKLSDAIDFYDVDVFCCHAYSGRTIYDLFFVNRLGIPVIMEYHNIFLINAYEQSFSSSLAICRFADILVTLSEIDALFWRLMGIKSIYIPNPVESFAENIDEYQDYNILWIQRINNNQKQVFDLPDILMYVKEVLPQVRLTLVGESDVPETEIELKKMFIARGLADNVVFEGFHREVDQYYKNAAIVLVTSAFEGFSMVIYESKKFGVPIVMYELPYLEQLKDGRGYISVPQCDKRSIAQEIVRILTDKVLRDHLSYEAKSSAEEFSRIDIAEKWSKAFELICENSKDVVLSKEEKQFKEIQMLLMQAIDRIRTMN